VNWFLIVGVVAGLLILDVCAQLYFSRLVLRQFHTPLQLHVQPAEPVSEAERVQFSTTGGLTLRGSLHWPESISPRGVIVFCPELNGSHWSAASYGRGLLEDGFAVLGFDFRNQGDSDSEAGYEPLHWVTDRETADLQSAVRYVRSRDDLADLPLGLMGVSRGGGAALAVAADDPEIRQVAVEGAFSTAALHLHYSLRWGTMYVPGWVMRLVPEWHVNSTNALSRWISQIQRRCRYPRLEQLLPRLKGRPVLLIAGDCDSYVPLQIPQDLCRRIGSRSCELWTVHNAKHNSARHVDPDVYDAKLAGFFDEMQPGYFAPGDSPAKGAESEPAELVSRSHAHTTEERRQTTIR